MTLIIFILLPATNLLKSSTHALCFALVGSSTRYIEHSPLIAKNSIEHSVFILFISLVVVHSGHLEIAVKNI